MNLLAHGFLSQHDPQLLLGNMIGDDVKGMQIKLYPPIVRVGIQLHRYIDSFTDQHPLLAEARNIYRPAVRLYAGPLMDISLDYFLASDTSVYKQSEWQTFASWAYLALQQQTTWHVGGFRRYFPLLKKENWFVHYNELPFVTNAMGHLLNSVGLGDKKEAVKTAFEQNLPYLLTVYQDFFPALQAYVHQKTTELLHGTTIPTPFN